MLKNKKKPKYEPIISPTVIVKVQRSQFPKNGLWIYSQDMTTIDVQWWKEDNPIPYAHLSKIMGMKQKAFYLAHIEDTNLVIDDNAEWQDW